MDHTKDIKKTEKKIKRLFRLRKIHCGMFYFFAVVNVITLVIFFFGLKGMSEGDEANPLSALLKLLGDNARTIAILTLLGSLLLAVAGACAFSFMDGILKKAKMVYWAKNVQYLQEEACERMHIEKCHVVPDSGVSRDEIVRSGMFSQNGNVYSVADLYLEGVFEECRFRGSEVNICQMSVGEYAEDARIPGYFWIVTGLTDCPCRLVIFSRMLAARLDTQNERNGWCGSADSRMKSFTTVNEQFNMRFKCYCDEPQKLEEFLTEEMMEKLMAFADSHKDDGLFLGFNHRELNIFEASVQNGTQKNYEDVNTIINRYSKGGFKVSNLRRADLQMELDKLRLEAGKKGMAESRHIRNIFRAWDTESIMNGDDATDRELQALYEGNYDSRGLMGN